MEAPYCIIVDSGSYNRKYINNKLLIEDDPKCSICCGSLLSNFLTRSILTYDAECHLCRDWNGCNRDCRSGDIYEDKLCLVFTCP